MKQAKLFFCLVAGAATLTLAACAESGSGSNAGSNTNPATSSTGTADPKADPLLELLEALARRPVRGGNALGTCVIDLPIGFRAA